MLSIGDFFGDYYGFFGSSVHHNSCNGFGRALIWAEKHRPALVAIYWRTKKWRTRKKIMRRIIKEWREADAKAKKELRNEIRRACGL